MKRSELVRGLNLSATTSLVVGTIIGTGIFLKSAKMAQAVGTPALVLLAWVAAGLLSLAGALSYAELGAMLPAAPLMYSIGAPSFSSTYAATMPGASPLINLFCGPSAVPCIA